MTENELATIAVDISLQIHKELGPGLLESVYEAALLTNRTKGGLLIKDNKEL